MAQRNSGTNVRSGPPWPLRAGLGALGAISPALAARAAARLFLTPPRHRAPPRDREALAPFEPLAIPHEGGTLRAFRLGRGPVVLLVHGWGGRAGQMAPLAEALAAAGCAAVALDGPAHGASSGRTASVVHFAASIASAARATGARAAVGHSLGGAAVLLAVARGLRLDAAVALAAPRGPASFFDHAVEAFGLESVALRDAVERRVGVAMADLDLPHLAFPGAPPLLLVHDRDDGDVPFAEAEAVRDGWSGSRLVATAGLGHRRLLRERAVIQEVAAFVTTRLARCGCGRLAEEDAPEPRCAGCAVADDLWERARRQARSFPDREAPATGPGPGLH